MAFDGNSTLGDLMADERAAAVMEKHIPGISENPSLQMGLGLTLKQCKMIPPTKIRPVYDALVEDLAKL